MNPFNFIFCYAPFGVVLLALVAPIMDAVLQARAHQRKIDLHDQKMIESKAKTAALLAIAEAKTAEANNKVLLQDLEIELRSIKIKRERQKLGLDSQEFIPKDYE